MHYEVKLLFGLLTKTDEKFYLNSIKNILSRTPSELAKRELSNILKIYNNEQLYNTELDLTILITLLIDEHLDKYLNKVEKELSRDLTNVRKQNYENIKNELMLRKEEIMKEDEKSDRRRTI